MNEKKSVWLEIGRMLLSNVIGVLLMLLLITASFLLGFSIVTLLIGIVFLVGLSVVGLLAIIGIVLIPSVIGLILGSIVWYVVKTDKNE